MSGRARILVFDGADPIPNHYLDGSGEPWEVVRVHSVQEGLARLQQEQFDGIYATTRDPKVWQRTWSLLQTDAVLEILDQGVAAVHPDLRIVWANATFEKWCSGAQGRLIHDALGFDAAHLRTALQGKTVTVRLHRPNNQFLEIRLLPLKDSADHVVELIALCRDVTAEMNRHQQLDRLHQAGRELAALNAEELADMDIEDRVGLLKHNIRKLTHDLLRYDVIEIRLLDPVTGRLEPLLADGMLPEAATRELFAKEEGNGVTGYVAATGRSYVCADTATDPHYIEGAKGARSSLTVALTRGDSSKVIGTFNVESPEVGEFGEQDLQFAEIFCRELASALHTLELLLVEKQTATTKSIEAINREVALPVDEILANATSILDRWIGHEPEMADKLRKIIHNVRQIKRGIQQVGENMAPATKPLAFQSSESPNRLKGKRVLVVDNDDRVRRSAHSILGRMGCVVETARDGKEAQTIARLSTYDAIMADIRLPDLSGYEVYRALKDAQPNARVILMTGFGYDPSHSIVKARQDGLRFVLYKPFRVEQLFSALESPEPPQQPACA